MGILFIKQCNIYFTNFICVLFNEIDLVLSLLILGDFKMTFHWFIVFKRLALINMILYLITLFKLLYRVFH